MSTRHRSPQQINAHYPPSSTYIVITYYNVKQKDLNLLDKFQTGITATTSASLPRPSSLHYKGFRNKRLRIKVFQLQDPDPWQQLRAAASDGTENQQTSAIYYT